MRKLSTIYYLLTGNLKFNRLIYVAFFSLFSLECLASDPGTEFQKANGLYQKQQYDSAAKVYEQLLSQEYKSVEVSYNLANCYYKLDNISRAIINYERALKLHPDDEDAAFNLKVAQLKVVDKIEAVPEIFYIRWIKSASSALTVNSWSLLVIISTWLTFLFASIYILSRRVVMKRLGFLLASFFLLVSILTAVITNQNYANHERQKSAIVMSISAYVKSSPGDNNTDLFLLHEGTRVDILDEYESWVKIRIANGSIGWLKRSETEEI